MNSLPSVLIFTYSEHGQANVSLATSYELALAGVEVYIASFAPLETRIAGLQERISRQAVRASRGSVGSVTFCEYNGFVPYVEAVGEHGFTALDLRHPPGRVRRREKLLKIITTIRPDVVVIDFFFKAAGDACKLLGKKFTVIMPNSTLDVVQNIQPYMAGFWKYPVVSSGFPFPLSRQQSLLNIYLSIRLIVSVITSTQIKHIRALRRSLGIKPALDSPFQPGMTHICPSLPETDFPLAVVPEEMRLCGPIILPFDPLEESDPELKAWLDNGPTVMINLGTHTVTDETLAREVSGAIRMLLNHHGRDGNEGVASRMQVLWKAKWEGDADRVVEGMMGKEIREERVKVVPWLNAEPVAVLQHPNVVVTVHHGGANSFFEGVWSGVPHVVLPVWLDTYHYAARVEYLNIGIFGSKRSAPGTQAEELGRAFVRVTGHTEEAVGFAKEAKRLKEICRARGSGRELASLVILKEVRSTT